MKRFKRLGLLLALAMLGGVALGDEAEPVEAPVEEVEVTLGADEAEPSLYADALEALDAPGPETPAAAAPTALQLPAALTMGKGETLRLAPVFTPADAACQVTYATSSKKIVAVGEDGTLTAKKKGVAVITATSDNGLTASVTVTVAKGPRTVTLMAPEAVGEGDRFGCRVEYNAGAGGGYTLTSDNAAVLQVEADGAILALAQGTATLTARSYNGREGRVTVKVLAAPTTMWMTRAEAEVGLGGTLRLGVGFPQGTGGTARYESSDPSVAAVDAQTGEVTGAALGEATILARSYNGLEDRCTVRVLPAPEQIVLPAERLVMGVGEQVQLAARALPEGSACSLTFKSGKPKYVEASPDGALTAKKKGKAVITATAQNGVSAKVTVQVLPAPKSVSLRLSRTSLAVGETASAQVTLSKKSGGGYTLTCDNPAVAGVAADGTVTALSEGAATLTVTTYNGLTASATLTVGSGSREHHDVSGPFEITFMNVGRNDGILIHCGGEWAYIDSGLRGQGYQAVDYMRAQGVTKLKYYIASHGHEDHIGGAPVILAAFPTEEIIAPHDRVISQIRRFCETAGEKAAVAAAKPHIVLRGDRFSLGGADFLVLGPAQVVRCDPDKDKENYNSLIIRVTYGSNTFLLTGDATNKEFKAVEAADPGCLRAQVYKVPHHNSTFEFPAIHCQPRISVVCTSSDHNPKSKYVKFIHGLGSDLYITSDNRHGTVRIVSDGTNLTVTTQREYAK